MVRSLSIRLALACLVAACAGFFPSGASGQPAAAAEDSLASLAGPPSSRFS